MGDDEEVLAQPRTSMSVASSKKVVFMPVDSVPGWIKDKVSAEEYQLWKALSSKFSVDYSILEYPLTDKQKSALYTTVSALAKDIESGEIVEYMGLFSAANLIDSVLPQQKMLKNRSESGGGEIKEHDTGLLHMYYFDEAKADLYVGARYIVQKKEAVVTYSYYDVSSVYDCADLQGFVDAYYVPTYTAISFIVDGPLVYIHPTQGLTYLYFSTLRMLQPISVN